MSAQPVSLSDPRIRAAVDDLEHRILGRFPTASFSLTQGVGDDSEGIYLIVTVDADDPDAVLDLVIDRLLEIEDADALPLYVLPMRTPERIAREMAERDPSFGATASRAR